jgi:hypothetical protein
MRPIKRIKSKITYIIYNIIIAINFYRIVEHWIKYILKIRSNRILKFSKFNSIRFDSIYIHRIRIIRRFDRSSKHPEHAPSQPAHHNVEPILAPYMPRLQFPYRILRGNPFLLPRRVSAKRISDCQDYELIQRNIKV